MELVTAVRATRSELFVSRFPIVHGLVTEGRRFWELHHLFYMAYSLSNIITNDRVYRSLCVFLIILKVTQVTVLLVNSNPSVLSVTLRVSISLQLSYISKGVVKGKRSVLELLE